MPDSTKLRLKWGMTAVWTLVWFLVAISDFTSTVGDSSAKIGLFALILGVWGVGIVVIHSIEHWGF